MTKKTSVRINKTSVDALRPGQRIADDKISGFYCRCQKKKKVYSLKYLINGRQRWYVIGAHGDGWTAEQARIKAEELRTAVNNGVDIVGQKHKAIKEDTVSKVADRYLEEHVRQHNKPSTIAEVERIVKTRIKPNLGKLKISKVTRSEIHNWHQKMKETPYEGNRALAYCSKMMSFAAFDHGLRQDNPCKGIRKHPEKARDRIFSQKEIHRIGVALVKARKTDFPEGCINAVLLLALTGCRLGEVFSFKWENVNLKDNALYLSAAKAGARSVPLGDEVVSLLKKQTAADNTYIVHGDDPKEPLSESVFRRFWVWLKENAKLLDDARPHDFRHTAGTYAAQANHNAFVIRDYMGHKTIAMTNRYVSRAAKPALIAANSVSNRIASDIIKP
jgi:integrase